MIRYSYFLVFILLLSACQEDLDKYTGHWHVSEKTHKAEYSITIQKDGLECAVLRYDDGTTRIKPSDSRKYLFKGYYPTDGATGATTKGKPETGIRLELVHRDTLLFHEKIHGRTVSEKWSRKK